MLPVSGNVRANKELNPKYDSTFVFTNDFAAFLSDTQSAEANPHPLLSTQAGTRPEGKESQGLLVQIKSRAHKFRLSTAILA
jgi:galactose-1-phosphate uridylyltransferase